MTGSPAVAPERSLSPSSPPGESHPLSQRERPRPAKAWKGILFSSAIIAFLSSGGCATDRGPVLSGVYQTWDDVVTRWIGKPKKDLYYELGPPQFHKEADDGTEELVWDMTLPGLPGQAQLYNTLPLYGDGVDCKLFFFADPQGLIKAGRREGCD